MNTEQQQRHHVLMNVLQMNFGIEAARAHEAMEKAFSAWQSSSQFNIVDNQINFVNAMYDYLIILKGQK